MRKIIRAAFMLPVCVIAQTPITLNNANMPSSGDTLRFTNVNITSLGNYTVTGLNYNWDFSNVTSGAEGLRNFKSALSTPYALFFASFTGFGEKMPDLPVGPLSISDYYNFYRKPSTPQSAYLADGVGLTINSVPLPSYYTDKDELYLFPMTYPKTDSTTFRFSTPSTTVLPIRYSRTGHRITVVDGWGMVTTPYGTEACLRITTTEYGIDSIKNNIVPLPIGIPRVVRSYQWLTLNSKIPYFEVTGNLAQGIFTPTTVRYRGYKIIKDDVGLTETETATLTVYPNPVKEVLQVRGTSHDSELRVLNLMGAEVYRLDRCGSAEQALDVSGLPAGIYCLKVGYGIRSATIRFVKD